MSTMIQQKRRKTLLQGFAPSDQVAMVEAWCKIANISMSAFVRQVVVREAERNLVQHLVQQNVQ